MLIEIILPTVNKTFFIIIISCWFAFSYRNRAGYLWQLSNSVSFSLSLKSGSTTSYCWAKRLALQILVVIWEELQTHPLITFACLDFLFSFLESSNWWVVVFFHPCLAKTRHKHLGYTTGQPPRSGVTAAWMVKDGKHCSFWESSGAMGTITEQNALSDTVYLLFRHKTPKT